VTIARMRQDDRTAAASGFGRAPERASLQDAGQGRRGHRIPRMKPPGAFYQIEIVHLLPVAARDRLNQLLRERVTGFAEDLFRRARFDDAAFMQNLHAMPD